MFTASDFKIMARKCPDARDKLLKLLGIRVALPFAEDDFKSYEDLDITIEKKIATKLNSDSVVDGYAKLLDTGGVAFSLSETNTEMLSKILANRDKILQGAAAQARNTNSTSDSDLSFWARIVRFFKSLFGSEETAPTQPSDKLSREEIKNVFPILEQVNKIFNAI